MRAHHLAVPFCATSLLLAACGGGGDDTNIDAAPPAACGATAATLDSYPATYTGHTVGAGADLTVAEQTCADERGWYGSDGDDQVIVLANLTPGTTYVLDLDTQDDLSMYVTTTCEGNSPASGACLLHVDETYTVERGEFVAPAGGQVYVIIDSANDPVPVNGDYTLSVRAAQCTDANQCGGTTPFCEDFTCVQCTSSFDCTAAATPVCSADNTCVAGSDTCIGDDSAEQDDGPAAAVAVTLPTAGNPTVYDRAVCSQPPIEGDWFTFTLAAPGSLRVEAAWQTAGVDLDFLVWDTTGTAVGLGIDSGAGPEAEVVDLAAGTYYIEVYQYQPDTATATPYTLTLSLPECDSSFDCGDAALPVCNTGQCVAGTAQCTGDDTADDGAGGDDGPAAARDLTGPVGTPVVLTGNLCNTPSSEADWYKVTVAATEGVVFDLGFGSGNGEDLDIAVFDGSNRLYGVSFWLNPEVVTLSHLAAGTYYVRLLRFDGPSATAIPYTITATRTAATACVTRADCASVYSTQLYRGSCNAGACEFIPSGTAADGAPCDSFDDCNSGDCSYIAFESDADKSVCTHSCTSSTECASLGTGFACTTGFTTNVCLPGCAQDLECGANVNSSALDSGQPWNYFTCTASTGACSP